MPWRSSPGELVENNLRVGSAGVETRVPAGHAFSFGPDHIHRLNGAERGTVSVHAYSPPLWRLGQYAVSDSRRAASGVGVLRGRAAPVGVTQASVRVMLTSPEVRTTSDPSPETSTPAVNSSLNHWSWSIRAGSQAIIVDAGSADQASVPSS